MVAMIVIVRVGVRMSVTVIMGVRMRMTVAMIVIVVMVVVSAWVQHVLVLVAVYGREARCVAVLVAVLVAMAVVMMVVVAVIVHAELGGVDAVLKHLLGGDGVAFGAEGFQPFFDGVEIGARVDEGTHGHVAADAAEAVEVTGFHGMLSGGWASWVIGNDCEIALQGCRDGRDNRDGRNETAGMENCCPCRLCCPCDQWGSFAHSRGLGWVSGAPNHRPRSAMRLIVEAATAAPKPLSMLTTVTPVAQELSMPRRAASPPKLAP